MGKASRTGNNEQKKEKNTDKKNEKKEELVIIDNNNQDMADSGATTPKNLGDINMISSIGPEINPDRYLVTQYMVPKPLTQKGRKRNVSNEA